MQTVWFIDMKHYYSSAIKTEMGLNGATWPRLLIWTKPYQVFIPLPFWEQTIVKSEVFQADKRVRQIPDSIRGNKYQSE